MPLVFWRGTFGEDRRTPRLLMGTLAALRGGPTGLRVWLRDLPGVVRAVALVLLILAIARPVSTLRPQTSDEEGIDIVLVLDLSGSMQAIMDNFPEDLAHLSARRPRGIRPTRLDAAKAVIRDFISRRKTDRIGVVVFGKEAYVLSPPTLDYHLLDTLVSRMELKLIDPSATAIGDGLGVALARLRRSTAKSKAVILLTDGDNNAGRISPGVRRPPGQRGRVQALHDPDRLRRKRRDAGRLRSVRTAALRDRSVPGQPRAACASSPSAPAARPTSPPTPRRCKRAFTTCSTSWRRPSSKPPTRPSRISTGSCSCPACCCWRSTRCCARSCCGGSREVRASVLAVRHRARAGRGRAVDRRRRDAAAFDPALR